MPTYTYKCDSCERQFDVKQSYKDKPAAPCPGCGHDARCHSTVNQQVFDGGIHPNIDLLAQGVAHPGEHHRAHLGPEVSHFGLDELEPGELRAVLDVGHRVLVRAVDLQRPTEFEPHLVHLP